MVGWLLFLMVLAAVVVGLVKSEWLRRVVVAMALAVGRVVKRLAVRAWGVGQTR